MAEVKVEIRFHNEVTGLYYLNFINVDEEDKIVAQIQCGVKSLQLIHDTVGNALNFIRSEEEKSRVKNNQGVNHGEQL